MIPLKRELYPSEVEYHRRDDCVSYSECLMEAVRRKYASFSCSRCEEYEPKTEKDPCLVLSGDDREYVYPSYPHGGNMRAFGATLTKIMRKLGMKIQGDD